MSYSCKILLDSISETEKRLTTFEISFPRCVLAEAETHRVFSGFDGNVDELIIHNIGINIDKNLSRNSASSRAIPINKMLQRVIDNPFIPEKWGKPVAGMGAKEYWPINSSEHEVLTYNWKSVLNDAVETVQLSSKFGNKEDLNRLLEPFMFHTALITATEFDNFFKLRTNSAADWKIKRIVDLMYEAYHSNLKAYNISGSISNSPIQKLKVGEWHCPLVSGEDKSLINEYIFNRKEKNTFSQQGLLKRISVARCARISYLTHDGKRDIEKDLELFERLKISGHWSPFEHVATPSFIDGRNNFIGQDANSKGSNGFVYTKDGTAVDLRNGNFIGWRQMRQDLPNENCTNFRKEN